MASPKVTIVIPSYNNEKHIVQAIESALAQDYPLKEIIVLDDCSKDSTVLKVNEYPEVKFIGRVVNQGIGENLERAFYEAMGKYIVFLCADDKFSSIHVVHDIVRILDRHNDIGIVGRYYYYFMDNYPGAIGVCREKNILIQSCCPSGMAFRKLDIPIKGTNKIFVEMPSIVAQYLPHCRWTMLEYDTIGARFHPGGNTGHKKSYYTESPTQNWIDLLGQNYKDFPMFIQLKNRAPKLLWREICLHIKQDKSVLLEWKFWVYALMAILLPGVILRNLTNFYRHRIARRYAKIIERPTTGGVND